MAQKPQKKLIDNHGRIINYLRLAITDRCNLRCQYCMPAEGMKFVPHHEILSYEELLRLTAMFSGLGIHKVRVTGGEPFTRKDIVYFLQQLRKIKGVEKLYVTSNGVATWKYLDQLKKLGISGVNLSLDTMDPGQFKELTGSDQFSRVMQTLHGCLEMEIPVKVNTVVMDETTDDTILSLADLARQYPLTVRFIEKMPFSGTNGSFSASHVELYERVAGLLELKEIKNDQPSTARIFEVPGFKGSVGIIEGHSRKFCTTCNKLRVTPLGVLKTCLYDNGSLDLKDMFRKGVEEKSIAQSIIDAVNTRYQNGKVAEASCSKPEKPSMASIGG